MGTWYIKKMESEAEIIEKPNFFKRVIARIKMKLGILHIKEIENKTIVILPVLKAKDLSEKNQARLADKIAKRLYDKPNQNLVLAHDLNLPGFKNYLYSQNCNILDGRWLFTYLLPQVINYVAENVKMLNIITNDIEKFRRIEEYLYENKGIIVRLTNNRKKALLKSSLILNIDLPEEVVNEYVIPKKAILVNISEKITILSKRFSGINSNYYRISLPEKYKNWFEENNIYQDFDEAVLYESMLYKRGSYEVIVKEIRENESKIKCLVGNKGEIREDEYKLQ